MGTGSKVVSVILRLGELISGAIVVGIVGRFTYLIGVAGESPGSRLIYTEAIAAIGLVASIILIVPFMYSFYAFPLDLALFIMWMVAFGLLVNLTGTNTCTSNWYYNYWGYYWGGYYRDPYYVDNLYTNMPGCGYWRAVLAFLFIGALGFLVSFFLGLYNVINKHTGNDDTDTESNVGTAKADQIHPIVPGMTSIRADDLPPATA